MCAGQPIIRYMTCYGCGRDVGANGNDSSARPIIMQRQTSISVRAWNLRGVQLKATTSDWAHFSSLNHGRGVRDVPWYAGLLTALMCRKVGWR